MSSRIEQIIQEIEEYVDSCKFQPLSTTKIVVNKEEIEELLRELRLKTPDEIKRYQKIISNKDAILEDAAGLPVVPNACAEHENRVRVEVRRRVGGNDPALCCRHHDVVQGKRQHYGKDQQHDNSACCALLFIGRRNSICFHADMIRNCYGANATKCGTKCYHRLRVCKDEERIGKFAR